MFCFIAFAEIGIKFDESSNVTIANISKSTKNIVIPSFVRIIGPYACCNNEIIENVDFENNSCLYRISKYAFANCLSLNTLDLSKCKNLWAIEEGAFYKTHLNKIKFPDELEIIEKLVFSETFLKNINIPDSTKIIGEKAFFKSQLEDIVFGIQSNLFSIKSHAFAMTKIIFLYLPPLLEEIGPGAFAGTKLMNIIFLEYNPILENTNNCIVTKITKRLVASYVSKETTIEIPPNVKDIGPGSFVFSKVSHVIIPPSVCCIRERAFAFSNLKEITIPKTVQLIESYAFYKCISLTSLVIESYSTIIIENAFLNTGIKCGVRCPTNSIGILISAGIPMHSIKPCVN